MRNYYKGIAAGLILVGVAGAAAAGHKDKDEDEAEGWARVSDSWVQTDKLGSDFIVRTTRDQFAFSPTGRIDVREIGGSVEIEAENRDTVEFVFERKAAAEKDNACMPFKYEHDKDSLKIRVEWKHERDCHVVHARDNLTMKVPRGASVLLKEVGNGVKVTGLEGLLKISDVGNTAILEDIQQLEAGSIGNRLRLDISKLGPAGIKVESVGNSVNLDLPEKIDAHLHIGSVGNKIHAPGLKSTSLHDGPYDTLLGKGGPMIYIDSIGNSIDIHGPKMSKGVME